MKCYFCRKREAFVVYDGKSCCKKCLEEYLKQIEKRMRRLMKNDKKIL